MKLISIYQINSEKDNNRVEFCSLKELKALTGSESVDFSIYEEVYRSDMEFSNLDEIYEMFNLNRPEDFYGHSLSVSDIIKTDEGYFYCDSYGWAPVTISTSERKSVQASIQSALNDGFILQETGFGKYQERESYWRSQGLMVVSWYVGVENGQKKYELYTREKKTRKVAKKSPMINYETLTVKELREIAKHHEIKNLYKLSKSALIDELKKVA